MIGPELLSSGHLDTLSSLTMIMNHYGGLPMDSMITRWRVYIQRIDTIYIQFWRPVVGNQFTLVWQTKFTPATTGMNLLDVEEPVYIKKGDYMGFRCSGLGVIPYKMANCDQSVFQESRWYYSYRLNSSLGNTYSFGSSLTQCRLYSITVIGISKYISRT